MENLLEIIINKDLHTATIFTRDEEGNKIERIFRICIDEEGRWKTC